MAASWVRSGDYERMIGRCNCSARASDGNADSKASLWGEAVIPF
jgi:hypothetical protein